MPYSVHLLASRRHGTLYLGVTNDLARRVDRHKRKVVPGFSARYDVCRLVWYEVHDRIGEAIAREKSLKKWRRDWKITLIEEMNPDWSDLYPTLNR
ncbi:GIY-YIG nuclease family protein [Microvirga lotononidis]|uniref:Putative endonuclease containing a URI domain n=1 Tax=Microvirga lotononidis TaxID=864069 RepID=I4YPX4_9HYPH|nr:GIY-YIG nuclease family protein [Microvirga lotononidis]EIM26016.1 putative endonuclease containing a URI domain [Microvirga lotononidis]WQO25924.1 GIY-YIG nuclease family protein [Microvirga lotononidis]